MNEELKKIGLSEYEIKVYLTLLDYSSLTGSKLAKLSSVPQSKIYDTLYKLSNKNFVSILEVRPKIFKAVEPGLALKSYLRFKKEELEQFEIMLPKKISARVWKKSQPKTEELITVYRGRKETHPLVIHRFQAANKYVKDMLTFDYVPASVQREIKKCIQRGVNIYMLATQKEKGNLKLIREVKKLGVHVRYYPVTELRLGIIDGKESCQMIVNPKDLLDRVSLIIESRELTKALEHYFDYVWKKAEKL
ncbi:TrmB family transcriptional regulator [Candidatus Woesearchaeota archaeon]|nr:TrmB family transcriptional regulator [Candidatus Woesearchaeota archaeon]